MQKMCDEGKKQVGTIWQETLVFGEQTSHSYEQIIHNLD